ncbi:MAG: hypothetical protein ACI9LU_002786 [Polaribacter sp.]|jgi:hypothetical protein
MMFRLLIVFAIVVLLVAFVRQLKNYLARDRKIDELRNVELQGDLVDIDLEIAHEKARQKDVNTEIDETNPRD